MLIDFRCLAVLALGSSVLLAAPPALADGASYEPYSGIERGTDGVDAVRISISGSGISRISCSASLAHWYSQDLGTFGPDAVLSVTLWHDPASGELSLLNASEDRMPVEAIWCGVAEDFRDTRTRLPIAFETGRAAPALGFVCAPAPEGRLSCSEG